MILVDNFRIFVLVVGLCGTLIQPSQAQAAKCDKGAATEDCSGTATACGIDFATGAGTGCIEPCTGLTIADATKNTDPVCDTTGKACCCGTGTDAGSIVCNNATANNAAFCKEAHLKTLPPCGSPPPPPGGSNMKCLNEKEEEMECTGTEVCGIEKAGTTKGCIDPGKCGTTAAGDAISCEGAGEWCCCKEEKCDTKALACALPELKDKGLCKGDGSSPKPDGGSTPGGTDEGGSERSAVTLSVGSLVAIASVAGLSHRISSGA